MRFIFSTGSLFSYSIERCFYFAAQAGFDGIELMVDRRWDTRQPDYLKRLMDAYQFPILAVHTPFDPLLAGWPNDEVGRIKRSVGLAQEVGAEVVVHHLPLKIGYVVLQIPRRRQVLLPVPGWQLDANYVTWLESGYEAYQAGTDVTLCIENMPARRIVGRRLGVHYWNTAREIIRFPNITLDTTHLGTWGVDPEKAYRYLNGRVRHVHLSNYDGREHRRPEAGRLALDRLLERMAADGYEGAISLELHPDTLDAGDGDERIISLLGDSLSYCRAWAGRGA